MKKHDKPFYSMSRIPDWVTIREAVKIATLSTNIKIKKRDIYRDALCGKIHLSIYFQSPVRLRKVKTLNNKVKLKKAENKLTHRLCLLEKDCFINKRDLIIDTEGEYFLSKNKILDTPLIGYEYILIQHLLAQSLSIPSPMTEKNTINYGFSTIISGEIFQVFEEITWQERMKKQIKLLPKNIAPQIHDRIIFHNINKYCRKEHFPLHALPLDACFVLRHTELEKLIQILAKNKTISTSTTRISTPLSRLFWLSCKHNEAISPLVNQPYKLLSIFEQWALADGITDRLSGETLKTALERGSPSFLGVSTSSR
ncbi:MULTISPECIES: hypothetical protein [unclassified Brenneria]|uniref:hypothetical protein n=1 Tax=unclassified Brenneria TaxID=2634434 RepID=UPI0015555F39|nr:hypothetical protein [Brenneria sp. hezel4-2-4]MEE3651984.1 hypothetical protein [Brenneria sp. HEZEL_4_2_4]NPD01941.1 hypothetical protein [Brenneria sp. hezel4-2-4]